MIPEERAARIIWRFMAPSVAFEDFEHHLLSQQWPEWNRAAGFVADQIREAVEEARALSYEVLSLDRRRTMKRAIVLSGVSGTGKTYARLNEPELKELLHLDIADAYREFPELGWFEALHALLKRARKAFEKHDTVVIEGYFLRGSTSRTILVNDLRVANVRWQIREHWASFEVCQARIVAQFEWGKISAEEYRRRIELLKRCWSPQPSARR
jgi:hypothetical protein